MVASHGMAGVFRQRICSEMHGAWRLSDALSQCLSPEVPLGLARHAASGGEERERGDPPPPLLPPSLPPRAPLVGHPFKARVLATDCEEFPPPTFFLTNFASFFGSLPPGCSFGRHRLRLWVFAISPLAHNGRPLQERERGMGQETNE